MIFDALAQLSTIFRRRFLFNALLPTLVFSTMLAAVVIGRVASFRGLAHWWLGLDVLSKALAALAYLAAVWFLAAAVASQWRGIVRLFEGYPAVRLLGGHAPGIRWHEERKNLLWNGRKGTRGLGANSGRAYYRYTLPEDKGKYNVMPTALGNILRAGERYATWRYGMDTIFFWPRLYPLLPQQFQQEYEEFLINYEFPLVVSFEALLVAVGGGLTVIFTAGSPVLFGIAFGGGSLIAFGFYVLSLSSAEELAEQQRTAFDLYRYLLLEQWPTPTDVRDEKAAFRQIKNFIVWNVDPDWARPQSLHHRRHKDTAKKANES